MEILNKDNQTVNYSSSNKEYYCSLCGAKMELAWRQGGDYPLVYRCPQCGEKEAHEEYSMLRKGVSLKVSTLFLRRKRK